MASAQPAIVGDSFAVGYRFQRYWGTSMASAFFCGELGAGLFLVSLYYSVNAGMILGLVVTAVLKTYFHTSHMGVPAKSWRAILRPDRAWVSRGLIMIVLFTGFGVLHVVTGAYGLFEMGSSATLDIIKIVAALAAVGVMAYHGFAMSDSTAISLWDSRLMPLVSVGYALLGGAVVTAVLAGPTQAGDVSQTAVSLPSLGLVLVLLNAGLVSALLYGAYHGSPGARISAEMLFKGVFARQFVPLVFVLGLALPFALLLWAPGSFFVELAVAIAALIGYYAFRVFILRAGVYEPIMNFAPPE